MNYYKEALLTQALLKELLEYSPETGLFVWRNRLSCPSFKHAGKTAGCEDNMRYVSIKINGKMYLAHRLAWLYQTGNWPEDEIDHKNTIYNDNRWDNLRPAKRGFNMQNRQKASKGKESSLPLGVFKNGNRFAAKIRVDTKLVWLGSRATAEEAAQLYVDAKRRLHPGGML